MLHKLSNNQLLEIESDAVGMVDILFIQTYITTSVASQLYLRLSLPEHLNTWFERYMNKAIILCF